MFPITQLHTHNFFTLSLHLLFQTNPIITHPLVRVCSRWYMWCFERSVCVCVCDGGWESQWDPSSTTSQNNTLSGQPIHHYSCGLCTHSRSRRPSVQTWCTAPDYPFALRETPLSNGTEWLRRPQFVRLRSAFNGAVTREGFWFTNFFSNFQDDLFTIFYFLLFFLWEDKFPNLIFSLHLWQTAKGEEAWRKLTSPINNYLLQMIETNTCANTDRLMF